MKTLSINTLDSISGGGYKPSSDSIKKAIEWIKNTAITQLTKDITKWQKPQPSSAPYSQQPASAPASRKP